MVQSLIEQNQILLHRYMVKKMSFTAMIPINPFTCSWGKKGGRKEEKQREE